MPFLPAFAHLFSGNSITTAGHLTPTGKPERAGTSPEHSYLSQHIMIGDKMLKNLLLVSLLVGGLQGQDFQVKVHTPYTLPVLPDSIALEEFQLLNRDLGWKELFTAIIFPGYASKYALEDTMATYIMIGRYLGLTAMGAVALNAYYSSDVQTVTLRALSDDSPTRATILITGVATNVMLTILDWGYANLKLKTKQDHILYKYRRKPDLRSVDILDGLHKLNLP